MKTEEWRGRYPVGAEITYRDGVTRIKTKDFGLIPKSRYLAQMTDKVIGGGEELQKGWRVVHLDMSTHGEANHDRPENLAVIRCRQFKFKMLARKVVVLPKGYLNQKPASRQVREPSAA